jgi:hypothetical protein
MHQVLSALEQRDEQKLKSLTISQTEFRKFVWPSLRRTGIAKLGVNGEMFYSMVVKENNIGLGSTLKEYGGQKWSLIQVSPVIPERHQIRRKRLTAYSAPDITIREATGNERTVQVVGGIVQVGGVYKVSTYSLAPDQQR